MLGFIKNCIFTGLAFLSILTGINSLSCISMSNQECKVRTQIVNVNNEEPLFFPFSIKASKCSGSCNNINNPYAKLCVPEVVKNLNVKVFNLMSRINKTRHKMAIINNLVIINNVWMVVNAGMNAKN